MVRARVPAGRRARIAPRRVFSGKRTTNPGGAVGSRRTVAGMNTTNTPSVTPEAWLSKTAVATHYELSARTVERWIARGCASRLIGGVRRMRLSDVEVFLCAQGEL